jgi:hypothetical protein
MPNNLSVKKQKICPKRKKSEGTTGECAACKFAQAGTSEAGLIAGCIRQFFSEIILAIQSDFSSKDP